jgi:hypothetical protein
LTSQFRTQRPIAGDVVGPDGLHVVPFATLAGLVARSLECLSCVEGIIRIHERNARAGGWAGAGSRRAAAGFRRGASEGNDQDRPTGKGTSSHVTSVPGRAAVWPALLRAQTFQSSARATAAARKSRGISASGSTRAQACAPLLGAGWSPARLQCTARWKAAPSFAMGRWRMQVTR